VAARQREIGLFAAPGLVFATFRVVEPRGPGIHRSHSGAARDPQTEQAREGNSGRKEVSVKRKPVKPLLQALAGAVQRLHLRSYEIYQPVLTSSGYTAGARDCEVRWAAIAPVLEAAGALSLVDLGCSEGYYVLRAARAGLRFCIGIDFDQRRIFTCTNQLVLNDFQNAGFAMAPVDETLLEGLPKFDAVIFLSVLHHMMYQNGIDYAARILQLVAARTAKVCLFEMGQADEHKESWATRMPDMGSDPHRWIADFALANGFARVEKIAAAASFAGETERALFACYP